MMSTLSYALLGLLARESMSGYDLAQCMKKQVGFFWEARHSQIYTELSKLEEKGFLTYQTIRQEEKPTKKIYTITNEGKEYLVQWITEPMEVPSIRDELVLKSYSLWAAKESEEAIALFREHERKHLERLEHYKQILKWIEEMWNEEGSSPDSQFFGSYLAIKRGIGYEEEYANWCSWVVEQLKGKSQIKS